MEENGAIIQNNHSEKRKQEKIELGSRPAAELQAVAASDR